ncbi:ArsR/SmtB family transcription factor [Frigidibacter sp. ROC022]|uniref:ArsR/SmtB family transcription factor n=1 Tax=Frigidibacter sp. ROC022 TaxID=2971796 RepID=UPI00215AE9E9|nr:metalloregulator ArsR/SmtB family transcription factor [Frigidibacter sp. ROC022]MCR8726208.1 metalloregulator ArsR/SmtB family transcription factor [Frigidibacter sp. ROC022]
MPEDLTGVDAADASGQALPGLADLVANANAAAGFLKALAHDGRLLILCHLSTGAKSVTELETLLSSRQSAVSQHLARLRHEGMVQARRDGQAIYYSILDPRVARAVALLAELFCETPDEPVDRQEDGRRGR